MKNLFDHVDENIYDICWYKVKAHISEADAVRIKIKIRIKINNDFQWPIQSNIKR